MKSNQNSYTKPFFAAFSALLLAPSQAGASISLFIEYHLGEAGSLGTNNLPQDSSGNSRNMTNAISGGTASVVSGGGAYAGSTDYLSTAGTGSEGWYGPNLATLAFPTDNMAFGLWVQASANSASTQGDILTSGNATKGTYKLSLGTNGWGASANNVAWISPSQGVTGSFTADTWTHLMFVRQSGVTTFYINGVANGTYATAPFLHDVHLSVNPGGAAFFDGKVDEVRFVTFTAADSLASITSAVQYGLVPEPSAGLLSFCGLLLGLRRRR